MEPDLAGFADAQERLRDAFGELVVFLKPVEATWPPGTPLDPETNRPYDPVVLPSSSGQASAVVNCDLAYRPWGRIGGAGEVEWTALGGLETAHILLIASSGAASAIEGSSEFVVRDERYKVTSIMPDGVGEVQRTVVQGRKE